MEGDIGNMLEIGFMRVSAAAALNASNLTRAIIHDLLTTHKVLFLHRVVGRNIDRG
jgi:hypothetical protein